MKKQTFEQNFTAFRALHAKRQTSFELGWNHQLNNCHADLSPDIYPFLQLEKTLLQSAFDLSFLC